MKNLKLSEINSLGYTDFVSLIQEENRPPGGKKTVREILINSFVDRRSKVLEIGCTNGFTSLEIARLIHCQVIGVDINSSSINNAIARLQRSRTPGKVNFLVESAYSLPFENEYFDLVIFSNAISFVEDQGKALDECARVVSPWGFLAVVPIWYKVDPPEEIVNQVSKILGIEIKVRKKSDWLNFFIQSGWEIYYCRDYCFDVQSPSKINSYVEEMCQKEHLQRQSRETISAVFNRWKKTIEIFNQNLQHTSYSVLLLRKRTEVEETELFTTYFASATLTKDRNSHG